MLGSPPDNDNDNDNEAVVEAIRDVEGVADVHHVHLWQMQEHVAALDCHVVVKPEAWSRIEEIKSAVKQRLKEEFGISHSSLEFEHEDRAHQSAGLYSHGNSREGEETHTHEKS